MEDKPCSKKVGRQVISSKQTGDFTLGALQRKKIPKIRDYYESGWVGPGLTRNFFVGKLSQNSSKPVLIFWTSVYHTCMCIAKSCWLL